MYAKPGRRRRIFLVQSRLPASHALPFKRGYDAGGAKSEKDSTPPPPSGSPPAAPELHVLLGPELLSEILEAFIDFFAGVAVPPPYKSGATASPGDGEAGADTDVAAAAAAAEAAAAAGPALPTPSPNLVFAALQVRRATWVWRMTSHITSMATRKGEAGTVCDVLTWRILRFGRR